MKLKRLAVIVLMVAALLAYYGLDLGRYLSLDYFKSQQAAIETWRAAQPAKAALLLLPRLRRGHGLSLPGAAVMTLAGGAMFGLLWGTVVVSFASSRRDAGLPGLALPAARLGAGALRRAAARDRRAASSATARFYLFTLRLVPVFPFFVINLLMGLTAIRPRTFYWVSQLGMLAGTIVYVNAGTQLAQHRLAVGHPLAGAARLVRAARHLPADRQEDRRRAAARARSMRGWAQAAALRPQPGRDRRRLGRPGHRLHRRGGEGQGHAGREAQDGRRLPEHRLRAVARR